MLKKIESHLELYKKFAEGFIKGQESVKRKNQSGCCCILNDDNIESVCGAHAEWLDIAVFKVKMDIVEQIREVMSEAGKAKPGFYRIEVLHDLDCPTLRTERLLDCTCKPIIRQRKGVI